MLIPQETGYLLLLGAGPSPQMGTPPLNPNTSGRSAPSPVCRFIPAKLSTALLWAGLMKRRKLRMVSHHEWPLERWLGPHGTLFFLSGIHGGPTVSRPWGCSAERDRHSRVQSLHPRTARTPPELLSGRSQAVAVGTWAGLPEEVGVEEQQGGRCQKKPKKLGQHVRKGWVQEAAAGSGVRA